MLEEALPETEDVTSDELQQEAALSLPETGDLPEPPVYPEGVMRSKATRMSIAKSGDFSAVEEAYDAVLTGREADFRKTIQTQEFVNGQTTRADLMRQVSQAPPSQQNLELIQGLGVSEIYARKKPIETVMEEEFAKNFTNLSLSLHENADLRQFTDANPETFFEVAGHMEKLVATNQATQTLSEEFEARYAKLGNFATMVDYVQMAMPKVMTSRLNEAAGGLIPEVFFASDGSLKEEMYAALDAMPVEESTAEKRRILEALWEHNPPHAMEFLEGLKAYTGTDAQVDNIFSLLDTFDATVIGGGVLKSLVKGAIRASRGYMAVNKGLEGIGRHKEAATANAQAFLTPNPDQLKSPVGEVANEFFGVIPDYLYPGRRTRPSANGEVSSLSLTATNELIRIFKESKDILIESFNDQGVAPRRMTPEAYEAGAELFFEEMENKGIRNFAGVANIRHAKRVIQPGDDVAGRNVGHAELFLGKQNTGAGFSSRDSAARYAARVYRLDVPHTIEPENGDFFIKITKPIDETTPTIKEAFKLDTKAQSSMSMRDYFGSMLRQPDNFISTFSKGNRKSSVHLSNQLSEAFVAVAKDISRLQGNMLSNLSKAERKQRWDDFTGYLDYQQNTPTQITDPLTGTTRTSAGVRDNTFWEFETNFQQYLANTGRPARLPGEDEHLAYFQYHNLMDHDYMITNTKIFKDKAIRGVVNHNIMVKGDNGNPINLDLEGVTRYAAPDMEGANLVKLDGGSKTFHDTVTQAQVQDMIDNHGYKLVELAQPTTMPLKGATGFGDEINFVLTNSATKERNLNFVQAPHNPGPHWDFVGEHFSKQPKMSTSSTTGKTYQTGENVFIQGLGKSEVANYTHHLNRARKALLNGNLVEANRIGVDKLHLAADEIETLFKGRVNPHNGEITEPTWDINLPFATTTSAGSSLEEVGVDRVRRSYADFVEPGSGRYNIMAEVDKKHLGQRDAKLKEYDSKDRLSNARKLSPLDSLTAALQNNLRTRNLDDLKLAEIQQYLSEFGDVLEGVTAQDLRDSPAKVFHNAKFKTGMADKEKLRRAAVQRKSIEELMGTHTPFQQHMDGLKLGVVDSIQKRFGKDFAISASDSALLSTTDPTKFMRNFAFHTKLGLFAPVQLFLQAQTLAHASLLAPKEAADGLAFYTAWKTATLSPNPGPVLKKVERMMIDKFGWKEGELTELMQMMKASGLDKVEGENAVKAETISSVKPFKSKLGQAVDSSTYFFREGERLNRIPSMAMAYKQWKKANPSKALDDTGRKWILDRQDLLTNRMTRKSSASVQQGWTATATQFFSYQARMMEAFIGKELTGAEKMRLAMGYGAMYGVSAPITAAIGLPLGFATMLGDVVLGEENNPLGSTDVRGDLAQYAMENGIDVDKGVGAWLLHGVYGGLFGKTSAAERLGPGMMQGFSDVAEGKQQALAMVLGPSGAIIMDSWKHVVPFFKYMKAAAVGDTSFNLMRSGEQIVRALSTISSVNQTRMAYYISRYGEYRFKSGQVAMDELNTWDALINTFVGAAPRDIPDSFNIMEITRDGIKKDMPHIMKYYNQLITGQMNASKQNDHKRAQSYTEEAHHVYAMVVANFGAVQAKNMWQFAYKSNNKTLVEAMDMKHQKFLAKSNLKKSFSDIQPKEDQ